MSGDVNKVILVGRLGANPVPRETSSGVALATFSMATSRRWKKSEEGDEKQSEDTQWHRIVAWGRQAETCARYLKKGQKVYVEGSLRMRKYKSEEGAERMIHEIHAETVSFISAKGASFSDGSSVEAEAS